MKLIAFFKNIIKVILNKICELTPLNDKRGNKTYFNLICQIHRENGPAMEYANGTKVWYKNDKYHREDGPAIEWAYGKKEWYINGQLHREDGPAVEWPEGTKWWYLNGVQLTEEQFNNIIKLMA